MRTLALVVGGLSMSTEPPSRNGTDGESEHVLGRHRRVDRHVLDPDPDQAIELKGVVLADDTAVLSMRRMKSCWRWMRPRSRGVLSQRPDS